ncbi:MAG: hypothetical protein JNK00_13570 [Flavipsychrobacter sp.]|nr:hypothetical protein [Flavipsychrobacter sp.]
MKHALLVILICISINTTYAQVDLSRDPGKPAVPSKKSNAQLLKESQQPAQTQVADSINPNNYKANGIVTSPNGKQYGDNGQLNQQSQQYNIGNGGTKATNTINYDNAGKVQGSSTTIEFGKKKKK